MLTQSNTTHTRREELLADLVLASVTLFCTSLALAMSIALIA